MATNILTASIGKNGGIISNVDAVKQALEAYVKVRNQSVFESVKEKMANIAFKAAQNTRHTPREEIRAKISGLPITKDNGRKRSGNTQYVGQYKLINWQRKNMGLFPLGGSKNRINKKGKKIKQVPRNTGPSAGLNRFMDGKYKSFLQARARGSKFLRIGWALAASAMGKPFGRGDFGSATLERLSGKAYGGGATIDRVAPGQSVFTIYNGAGVFDLRYKGTPMRNSSDIARARAVQEAGLRVGVDAEIKSMYELVIKRNSEAWFGKKMNVKAV